MAKFTDAKNREWTIDIDPVLVGDVAAELDGLSLYTILDNGMQGLKELLDNQPVFLNAVYILCREQCREQSIDEREFLRGLKGDAMDAMCDAFYQALADFFPKKKRELLTSLMSEAKKMADPLINKASDKAMILLKKQFGKLSASLDLIQEDSASEDSSGPQKESSTTTGNCNPGSLPG